MALGDDIIPYKQRRIGLMLIAFVTAAIFFNLTTGINILGLNTVSIPSPLNWIGGIAMVYLGYQIKENL